MKRLCSFVGLSVVLFCGWPGAASACPVATGVALAVPVAVAAPVAVAPIVTAPVVAPSVVVSPSVPVVTSIAIPVVSAFAAPVAVLSSPVVVERFRARPARRFRTPVRSLLFR
jgi:hypothetical protein